MAIHPAHTAHLSTPLESSVMDMKNILITFVVVILAVKLAPKVPFLN